MATLKFDDDFVYIYINDELQGVCGYDAERGAEQFVAEYNKGAR